MNKQHIINEFNSYTLAYDLSDPKIKLKYDHTFRVAGLCEQIAESIDLSDADRELAWLIGMMHDIGRFEQVRRYGTFIDAESIDHAHFGADLLFKEGLFERFVPDAKADTAYFVEKAVRNHSAYRIEEGLGEELQTFCHILRDADKIDILRVNYETPLEDIYNVSTEELRSGAVSEKVKESFCNRCTVLRALKESAVDHVVGHVSLVFELVYPLSSQIVKEQGFLDKLLSFESYNKDTNLWFAYMREHVWDEG